MNDIKEYEKDPTLEVFSMVDVYCFLRSANMSSESAIYTIKKFGYNVEALDDFLSIAGKEEELCS